MNCTIEASVFVQLGFLLIGSGGVAVHVSSFHLTNLFPSSKATLLSMFAGLFNASGVLYALLVVRLYFVVLICFYFRSHAVRVVDAGKKQESKTSVPLTTKNVTFVSVFLFCKFV